VNPKLHRVLFVSLAMFALVSDLSSKYIVFKWLYPEPNREQNIVNGWFKFTAQYDSEVKPSDGILRPLQTWSAPEMPYVNKGALFGLGGKYRELSNSLFALISGIAAIGITIWVFRTRVSQDAWLSASLGLIMGGAVGNCYDRIVFAGVRDFMYFYKIEWPVFNFADCCLVVGTGILLVQSFFAKDTTAKSSPETIVTQNNHTPINAS
jgi:signal peptidase II